MGTTKLGDWSQLKPGGFFADLGAPSSGCADAFGATDNAHFSTRTMCLGSPVH